MNVNQLEILKNGVSSWNLWRFENSDAKIDLSGANLTNYNLQGVNFNNADLSNAYLTRANLNEAKLAGANLTDAYIIQTNLREANLSKAILIGAKLDSANLSGAKLYYAILINADLSRANFRGPGRALRGLEDFWDAPIPEKMLYKVIIDHEFGLDAANLLGVDLTNANLSDANLYGVKCCDATLKKTLLVRANLGSSEFSGSNLENARMSSANLSHACFYKANLSNAILDNANLTATDFEDANLSGCSIYGISAWDVKLKRTNQHDLIITPYNQPVITVDNLEVAQFIYLILNNIKIRDVINAITSKVVLILGSFSRARAKILYGIKNELRLKNYTPVVFDFDGISSRGLTVSILTLAGMARFVIADLTAAKSIPQELSHIIPNLPSVPVQPILLASELKYSMFEHWRRFPWVLPEFHYVDENHLLSSLIDKIIYPSEQKRMEQIYNHNP